MNEDVRYRTSTQYRLWSFTPAALAAQRTTTNRIATERVKAAVQRVRASRTAQSSAENTESEANGGAEDIKKALAALPDGEVNCLTVEEEMKLVVWFCRQTLKLGDHLQLPTDVKATAIQYLKRFYTTNSLMTYHPTTILKTALFFSTKTENHYFRLSKFCEQIGKTKEEDVLSSEFLLTQGLRFTFDVRHPFRALEGAIMEIMALAEGDIPALPGQAPMGKLIDAPKDVVIRAKKAHGRSKDILKTSALLSDAYFHYTPSQIMMAALLASDTELTNWYLGLKFSSDPTLLGRISTTLEKCREMLQGVSVEGETEAEMVELKALAKKLNRCRNPEKIDLVAINKKAKREGVLEDDGETASGADEKIIKKRKLERDALAKEGEDLFGPALKGLKGT